MDSFFKDRPKVARIGATVETASALGSMGHDSKIPKKPTHEADKPVKAETIFEEPEDAEAPRVEVITVEGVVERILVEMPNGRQLVLRCHYE